ncbi:MAG TPA: dienelactone hydrolase family protein [Herpetosiphon sp.]|uniref:Carboxymethylenebutenolidase n=1 Tax=Herpetosiphon aurantiacus (strain ATCC 23779 / DSM 785 / 114-95) TaxID=316274 RepID=A9AWK9_HERA2|nr:dienelactone hydrolase family protein [Herpetosiphon sp.]ABX06768.1 Carboxymethylenebutenolidase [Herpetosiphon aurantiacus DSM 785]HBW48511.1 dienelactone hydrolase family protein [Herpetosiphon sp.]
MNHLQQYLVDEFVEDYQEGLISRRQALKKIAGITGLVVATQLLAACGDPATPATATSAPNPTTAPTATTAAATEATPTTASTGGSVPNSVAENDPAIKAAMVEFAGGDGQLMAYLAQPVGDGAFPVVLVCHENRGLTPHIQDVARRVAKAGYIGLAVDLLSREGGTASITDADSVPGLLSGAPPERHVADFKAGVEYLKTQSFADTSNIGMVGFCFGGGVTWLVAAGMPELKAAVPFYGPPVPSSEIPKINAPVLAIYAEQDDRITSTVAEVEAAMQQNNKVYRKEIYPGVNHAFHNDTGQRYNAEAAQAAWAETLAWFKQYLV